MCMADDGDIYDYCRQAVRRARFDHKCDECGRVIVAGETYEVATGGYRRQSPDTWRTCAHCLWARTWIVRECRSWIFGMVYEDLLEHWQGELMRDAHLGRAIVGMRKRWLYRSGALMPVPATTVAAHAAA